MYFRRHPQDCWWVHHWRTCWGLLQRFNDQLLSSWANLTCVYTYAYTYQICIYILYIHIHTTYTYTYTYTSNLYIYIHTCILILWMYEQPYRISNLRRRKDVQAAEGRVQFMAFHQAAHQEVPGHLRVPRSMETGEVTRKKLGELVGSRGNIPRCSMDGICRSTFGPFLGEKEGTYSIHGASGLHIRRFPVAKHAVWPWQIGVGRLVKSLNSGASPIFQQLKIGLTNTTTKNWLFSPIT